MPRPTGGTPRTIPDTPTEGGRPKLTEAQVEALKVQKSYERTLKEADRMFGELSRVSSPSIKAMSNFTKVINKLSEQYSKVEHELKLQGGNVPGLRRLVRGAGAEITPDFARYFNLKGAAYDYSQRIEDQKTQAARYKQFEKNRKAMLGTSKAWATGLASDVVSSRTLLEKEDQREKDRLAKQQGLTAQYSQQADAYRQAASKKGSERYAKLQARWGLEALEADPRYKFNLLRSNITEHHLVAQDMSAGEAARRYASLRAGGVGGGLETGGGGWVRGAGHRGKFNRFLGVMGVPKGPLGALAVGALGYEVAKGAWNAVNTRSLGAENDREALARAGRMGGALPSEILGTVGRPGWRMNQTMATMGYSNFNQIANVMQAYGSPMGNYGALATSSVLPNMKYGGFATNVQYASTLGKLQAMGITSTNEDNYRVKNLFGNAFKTAVKEGLPPKQYFENFNDLLNLMSSKGIVISDESISKMALSGAGSTIPSLRNITGVAAQVNTYGNIAENLLGNPIANTALVSFYQRHLGTATPTAEQLAGFFGKNPGYGINTTTWSKKGMASYDKLRFLGPMMSMKYLTGVGANTPEFMRQAMMEQMKYSGIDPAYLMFAMGGNTAFNQKLFADLGYSKPGKESPYKTMEHISKLTGESMDSLEERYERGERIRFKEREVSNLKDLFGVIGEGAEDLGNLRKNTAAAADTSRALNDAMIPVANNMRIFNEGLADAITIFRHARILPP